jgi:hypothetical protein
MAQDITETSTFTSQGIAKTSTFVAQSTAETPSFTSQAIVKLKSSPSVLQPFVGCGFLVIIKCV